MRSAQNRLERLSTWYVDRIELSRGSVGHNVRAMEGLRGIAVFAVFLVHFSTLVEPRIGDHPVVREIAAAMHTIGNRGVDLFFVLSGYLIYGSLMNRPQPFGRFILRRIERIHPTFLVIFAFYLTISMMVNPGVFPGGWSTVGYLVANVALLPGLFPIEPLITVAWSLSYELFYYVAMPLLVVALSLRERSRALRILFFVALAMALVTRCWFVAGPVRLVMFVAGVLLYESIASRKVTPPHPALALSAVAVACTSTLISTVGSAGYTAKTLLLFVAFYAVCFAAFERPASGLARRLRWTPIRWLGNMSYSYYLIHGLTLQIAFAVLGRLVPASFDGPLAFFTLILPMFALTLVSGSLLFLFVEYPWSLSPRRLLAAPNAREAVPMEPPGTAATR